MKFQFSLHHGTNTHMQTLTHNTFVRPPRGNIFMYSGVAWWVFKSIFKGKCLAELHMTPLMVNLWQQWLLENILIMSIQLFSSSVILISYHKIEICSIRCFLYETGHQAKQANSHLLSHISNATQMNMFFLVPVLRGQSLMSKCSEHYFFWLFWKRRELWRSLTLIPKYTDSIFSSTVFQREKCRKLVYFSIPQRKKVMIVNLVPGALWVSSTRFSWGSSRCPESKDIRIR